MPTNTYTAERFAAYAKEHGATVGVTSLHLNGSDFTILTITAGDVTVQASFAVGGTFRCAWVGTHPADEDFIPTLKGVVNALGLPAVTP